MKKIVIILGPTAVGKSEIGVDLAKVFDGEIISADSVQIYRELDIGSAKITKEEMKDIPHHFIDILPPNSEFSVFEYVEMTRQKIDEILSRKKLPIIVGGTGLYIRALLDGYDFGRTGKQSDFREKLNEAYNTEEEIKGLYKKLQAKNPELAKKIKSTDKKRIIRALEITEFGELPSTDKKEEFESLVFNLSLDRKKLYERINQRVDIMLEKGLVEEVKGLLNQGVKKDSQSLKAIGYKEVIAFLDGEYQEERMVEVIKQHSRNYAKRQMTFFRSLHEANVIDVTDKQKALCEMEKAIKEWL